MYVYLMPSDYFNSQKIDENFEYEARILKEAKFEVYPFSIDKQKKLDFNGQKVIYRGWMLNEEEYSVLELFVKDNNGELLTSKHNYFKAHYLPNWYEDLKDLTPETVFVPNTKISSLINLAKETGWDKFFVKDFVKSLTTKEGSICDLNEIEDIVSKIDFYRGVEGGICLRKVENFDSESEIRYFVFLGRIYSPTQNIPEIVKTVADRIDLPFYSVDIIKEKETGKEWVVEIGDGQVSSFKDPFALPNYTFYKTL